MTVLCKMNQRLWFYFCFPSEGNEVDDLTLFWWSLSSLNEPPHYSHHLQSFTAALISFPVMVWPQSSPSSSFTCDFCFSFLLQLHVSSLWTGGGDGPPLSSVGVNGTRIPICPNWSHLWLLDAICCQHTFYQHHHHQREKGGRKGQKCHREERK